MGVLTISTSDSGHAGFFQTVQQHQVFNEADFEADLFALESLEGFHARLGDDHVVSVAVVGQHDDHVFRAVCTGDERVAIGDHDGVDLPAGEGFHRGAVLEPEKFGVDAGLLDPAFLNGDFPRDPAGPVTVGDFQWSGRKR